MILPLAAAVTVAMLWTGWRRGAVAWISMVAAALLTMGVLKVVFAACRHLLPWPELHSPSGHTASAAVIYGGLVTLLVHRGKHSRRIAVLAAAGFGLIFGLSRLALGVHSLIEVVVGGAVGVLAALCLVALAGDPPPGWRLAPVCLAGLLAAAIFHGTHLRAEYEIDRFAMRDVWPLTVCRTPTAGLPRIDG